MATIRSQMVLNDGISKVLRKINTALNTTLNAFEQVQRASGNAVDTAQIQAARAALVEANREVDNMAEGYRRAAQEENRLNQNIRNGTSAADGMLNKVKSLVTTLAAGAGAKALLNLSDRMTSTRARLDFLVDDGGSVDELEQKIMASAQRSRAAYLDTASAIASMGANAGSAFSDNDELIAFMEQVNKQFVIGGATAEGQSAAMLQLTQAMAAGALRGEELNSILENAPGIARAIESYMGVAEGSIKQYAEQGLITSEVVKNALLSAAQDTYDETGKLIEGTNSKFESMPKTWAQIWIGMQNQALSVFDPILTKLNQVANSAQFSAVASGVINGLATIATLATAVLNIMVGAGSLIVDNWSWIEPIIWGVVAALVAYNAVQGISWLTTLKDVAAKGAHAVASAAETAALLVLIAAQDGLNAAMAACPVTWIIVAIIALIAIIVALVRALNVWGAESTSVIGTICGLVAVAGAFILNTGIGVLNAIIQAVWTIFVAPFLGIVEWVLNVCNGGFNSFGGAVANLIGQIIGWFLNLGKVVTTIIDAIFGTDWTSGLESLQNEVTSWGKNENAITLDKNAPTIDYRMEYGDAFSAGANFGDGIVDKFTGLGDQVSGDLGLGSGFDLDSIADYSALTAENTGATADALTASNEELAYLRDIAEREAINRFTTAEVRIDMTGMTNRIEGNADLDGVISVLTDGFTEALVTAAEGVHT